MPVLTAFWTGHFSAISRTRWRWSSVRSPVTVSSTSTREMTWPATAAARAVASMRSTGQPLRSAYILAVMTLQVAMEARRSDVGAGPSS